MPTATVTVRKLKNESSGLDLCIPTVKEIPGLLVDTVEYHVLVVSNLQFFKLPQHKETDVVQFVIPRHFEDFENLRKGLLLQYPGTVLPPLSTSLLPSFLESNTSERTAELESFLKFIAITPKLATSHVTLEFLGVNPLTAGKYTSSPKVSVSVDGGSSTKSAASQPSRFQLFQDNDEESSDLFGSEVNKEDDDELFSTKSLSTRKTDTSVKLFEDQYRDLDAPVSKDDLKTLGFLHTDVVESAYRADTEDISQLLEVEDDISQLLKLEEAVKARHKPKPEEVASKSPVQKTSEPSAASSLSKPSLPPKPGTGKKPPLPQKPAAAVSGAKQSTSGSEKTAGKEKPAASGLGIEDILNYIKDNPVDSEGDLQLF